MSRKTKWAHPTNTRTYALWCAMRHRCKVGSSSSKNHGDRGIRVTPEWDASYDQFVADMGFAPDGMTLERNDNNGGYSPANCRWATDREQRVNKRNNHRIEHNGESRTISEWAEHLGVPQGRLHNRINTGEPVERVLSIHSLRVVHKQHGTLNGYNYYRCRCSECRAAKTVYQTARKRAITLKKKEISQ